MFRIEQLRRYSHRDGEVASELIIRPLAVLWRAVNIFVDASAVDDRGVDGVLLVVGRIYDVLNFRWYLNVNSQGLLTQGYIEVLFEGSLKQIIPLLVRDKPLLSVD